MLVHLYLDIDVATVAGATQHASADFTAYRDRLAAWLGGREPPTSSE